MAHFKRGNLQLKTNQEIQLGDSQESLIKYDGSLLTLTNDGGELALDSTGITVIGAVTANSYYGNGSHLTDVIADLVNDISPQLGGDLDANGNVILLDDGTEAAPGLAFGSSPGTGFWYTYKLHISHNGDEIIQMFYNSGQNVSYIQTEALPSNQDTADLVLKTAATTGTGVAGDARLEGGVSSPGGTSGHARVVGGNSSTGQAGDVVLTPGTAGDPAGEDGAVNITQTEPPPVTTDRLYNVAGALTWNGTDLTASGSGGGDLVDDTSPQLGGDLDTNGSDIIVATADQLFIPNGTFDDPAIALSTDPNTGIAGGTLAIISVVQGAWQFAVSLNEVKTSSTTRYISGNSGTAAAPAYPFTNQSTLGMYYGGSANLMFSTDSTARLEIESDGTLNVAGTTDYEDLVLADDDIPNKKYVDDEIGAVGGSALPENYLTGLNLANVIGGNGSIIVDTGSARDASNTADMVLSSTLTKAIGSTWAAGDVAGGMFSGVSLTADTWYHFFIIKKDSDGSVDAGYDTSITAANIPGGYTAYRRVGSVLYGTGGSYLDLFFQHGDYFFWKSQIIVLDTTTPATSAGSFPTQTPSDIEVEGIFNVVLQNPTDCRVDLFSYGVSSTNPGWQSACVSVDAGSTSAMNEVIKTAYDNSIEYDSTNSSVTHLYVTTKGFIDSRGK